MKIEWGLLAIADRETIFEYIVRDSPPSAVRIDKFIETQVELLASSPELGRPGRIMGTRELVVSHTPYIVAYRITSKSVRILRVLHGAQAWPSRF